MHRRRLITAAVAAAATMTATTIATAGALSAINSPSATHTHSATSSTPDLKSEIVQSFSKTSPTIEPVVGAAASTGHADAAWSAKVATESRASEIRQLKVVYTLEHVAAAFHAAEDKQAAQQALTQAQAATAGGMWSCIRNAESGGNYSDPSGAYGILISTWDAYASIWSPYGSWGEPGEAPAAVQDLVAYRLYEIGGGFGGWHDYCTDG